jgi:cysteine desulfurase / selenocysteine lyase
LARLANEFFAALPGAGALPAVGVLAPSPSFVPATAGAMVPPAEPGIGLAARTPALAPSASSATGAPDTVTQVAPTTGRAGGPLLGVPEAYAAAMPQVGPSPGLPSMPTAPPSSPYYFLGETSGYPSTLPALPREDRLSDQGAGLPGQDAQLTSITPSPAPLPASATGAPHGVPRARPSPDRAGGQAPIVPDAYAAALPQVGTQLPATPALPSTPVAVPSTPYYFLGEASAYPSIAPELPRDDRVTAQPFLLRGQDDPGQLRFGDGETGAVPPVSQSHKKQRFYFVDDSQGLAPAAHPPFDVHAVRRDFPILAERVNGKQLIWLDNAATTQKPQAVIDRLTYFYSHENSNIHRAAHELAARATDAYEAARSKVARFLGAGSSEEIVFVRGATEAINLVAQSWGRQNLDKGDEIVISHLEHHANIVPWQQVAAEKGAKIRVIPVDDSGQILLDEYRKLLSDRTKIVAISQVSNALGTITPVREVIEAAHAVGARALIDGAQAVSHLRVNVQALDADFYVFSGHKIFAPTGIGVVYGKKELLDAMPPWQGGGNMITNVTFEKTEYHAAPARFEAGTGNIADAVGLGAALDYLERLGLENVARYEHDLLVYATRGLLNVPGLKLIGTARDKTSVLSFVLDGYRVEDVGQALSREGIAVRAGHHCAQPILRRFGLEATVRPSLAFYNTYQEIDTLVSVLQRLAGAHTTAGSTRGPSEIRAT